LDDLQANYIAKQKRDQAKEQGVSEIMRGREGRESGARSGTEQPVYSPSLEKLWLFFDTEIKWETK
jgi:hypothetical protein